MQTNNEITTSGPYLIFYLEQNPDFGKTFTIDDIPQNSEEVYSIIVSDCMTLGRQIPTFDEWDTTVRNHELNNRNESSKCALNIQNMPIMDEDDLMDKLKKFPPTTRFIDPTIQSKFEKVRS